MESPAIPAVASPGEANGSVCLSVDDLKARAKEMSRQPSRHEWPWPVLRHISGDKPDVLVDRIIQAGDQVLLSAAPKAGKSFLALELALKLASGSGAFLLPEWVVNAPRRVLYVSFEMPPGSMANRLPNHEKLCLADPAEYGANLHFLFPSMDDVTPPQNSLIRHSERITQAIQQTLPHFIVFDTLIQMHSVEENDNVKMGEVMRSIRRLCRLPPEKSERDRENGDRIAHLLLHHNRKALSGDRGGGGIAAARGAGSIHSEVDAALVVETSWRDADRATLGISTRHTDNPPLVKLEKKKSPSIHYFKEPDAVPEVTPVALGLLAEAHEAARKAFAEILARSQIEWEAPEFINVREVEVLICDHMFKALTDEQPTRRPGFVRKQIKAKDDRISDKQFEKAWKRLVMLNLITKVKGSHSCLANDQEKDQWLEKVWPEHVARLRKRTGGSN